MNTASLGDLAQGFMLRGRSASLKQDIHRLSQELSTGRTADVRSAVSGNYAFLAEVELKTVTFESYRVAGAEAAQMTGAMQVALESFSTLGATLSGSLLSLGMTATAVEAGDVAAEAHATLDAMVATLNQGHAGRALFSGNRTDTAPLEDTETLLAALRAALVAVTDPADLMAQAAAWFDDPAGFDAQIYRGGDDPLSPFGLSDKERVALDVRAREPGLKRSLMGAAVAALATDPSFGFDTRAQVALFDLAGQHLLVNRDGVTGLQARVGFVEARVETAMARNAAELSSLTLARNSLLEADPYDTATRLEEAQFQLQSIYSVTVRMSQLSLVNYL